MDNEVYRVLDHAGTIAELLMFAIARGESALSEHALPDGRIADVITKDSRGHLSIYEVKTEYKASLVSNASHKYWRWCNYLYMAVPDLPYEFKVSRQEILDWGLPYNAVGIVGVYPGAMRVFSTATYHHIHESNQRLLGIADC